jgi:NAD(P)-dependent dehydrogenase (short-subunit alcohol dehydrogenase family)
MCGGRPLGRIREVHFPPIRPHMSSTIFITGASSGIGLATALHFHAAGWQVVATMRAPERDTPLHGLERVLVTRLDVQDGPSIEAAVQEAIERFGSLDVLLNNAGYGAYGPLEVTGDESMSRQFDVNVFGMLRTTRAMLPHFRAQGHGVVINVSSMGGRFAFPLGALYHGTKFAVEGLSEALQYELASLGIRVKVIEPGAIRTDFAGRSFDFVNAPAIGAYQPLVQRFFDVLTPLMATAGSPDSVAQTIFRAATDGTSRLRYTAGGDAEQIIEARRQMDDASFHAMIGGQFGIDLTAISGDGNAT